jgi:hypothetical protein
VSELSDAWDQLPGETARAHAGFAVYRNLPPKSRSLDRAASIFYGTEVGVDVGGTSGKRRQFERWSARWAWTQRVAEWQAHLDRASTVTTADEVALMARRHWELGRAMVGKAAEFVDALDPTTLTATQAVALADAGVRIERLARGDPVGDEDGPGVACPQDTIRDFLTDHPELAGEFGALAAAIALTEQADASDVVPLRRRGPRRRTSNE